MAGLESSVRPTLRSALSSSTSDQSELLDANIDVRVPSRGRLAGYGRLSRKAERGLCCRRVTGAVGSFTFFSNILLF